ncbi:phosphopantetheine-binding protein [Synechococcus sp. AH-551-A21]|nr:phosphopantetheine-binding protein [Synechococcus sp. AH-551-A21]MDB4677532.1 phosphopantetheine-binding protein [Synechococcus sp. AH-551-A21]
MSNKGQITEYILSNTRNMMPYGHETPDSVLLDKNLNDLDIDSLELMEFFMILEEEYNIKLKDTEIEAIAMSSTNNMIDLICKKIKK